MSNLTCRHVDVYQESVDSTCDAIDGTIKVVIISPSTVLVAVQLILLGMLTEMSYHLACKIYTQRFKLLGSVLGSVITCAMQMLI
jgi:hypothetical protein